ncbi:MAG: PorT family protein [Candidatus Marinimicrobia bacterium]|nr:PorT family protein [Candidatus Neomarinimicrobiota bacterium]
MIKLSINNHFRNVFTGRSVCIVLFFLVLYMPGLAKVQIKQSGIMGGMTITRLWGDHVTNESWNSGGWLGTYLLSPVADNLFFRPEINFNMRGYHYIYEDENDRPGDKREATLRLNYLDFPLLFQFAVSVNETLVPDMVIGPYVAWNISATSSNKVGDTEIVEDVDSVRKYDLGIIAGSRIHYAGHFHINLRSGAGLLPIVDKSNPPRKYNLWILVGLEYRF